MAIRIKESDPDVYVTREELGKFQEEYNRFMQYYVGYISFEQFIKNRLNENKELLLESNW